MERVLQAITGLLDLGGPVVLGLGVIGILTLAVILFKLWQLETAHVGRHHIIQQAIEIWDKGDQKRALDVLQASRSYLAPVVRQAMENDGMPDLRARIEAEAETRFSKLEGGFRILDSVAQIAPLLGLFGTVLGMIDAFQALQKAGSAVDPSLLAGGIWVALLTTAVGLAVAMPTSLILSWFDARMTRERVFADLALSTIIAPQRQKPALSISDVA
ncbi:MAG: MotA/TolQ/ExbB proton channel family protein [Pseudomonadota bacterium]